MILWLVVNPLEFAREVLLVPPILFTIIGLVSHVHFVIIHNPG